MAIVAGQTDEVRPREVPLRATPERQLDVTDTGFNAENNRELLLLILGELQAIRLMMESVD